MRIAIVGGPLRGKSTLAQKLGRERKVQVWCADPRSKVRQVLPGVKYLPESLDFRGERGAAAYVARHWLNRPGSWIVEGHAVAEALDRWLLAHPGQPAPVEEVHVRTGAPYGVETYLQAKLAEEVARVWATIASHPALRGRLR